MLIQAAIDEFKEFHDGNPPVELVFTPHAALALGVMEEKTSVIPTRVEAFDGSRATPHGQGKKLGFFVASNGVQQYVAVAELS